MSEYHPIVEVLYGYESTNDRGHSVIVQPGEKYVLICDQDEEWWYVGKDLVSNDGFYIPRTYVTTWNGLETFRRPIANRQSAIITSNLYSLATNSNHEGGGGGDATASSLRGTRRHQYNPGFKLADPNRISRSIPVDLNFVHHIPNFSSNGFNNSSLTNEKFDEIVNDDDEKAIESATLVTKKPTEKHQILNGNGSNKINDGPIYANLPLTNLSESPPVPSDLSNYVRILQDGWKAYEDQYGRPYFYNTNSRISSWKPPRVVSTFIKPDTGMLLSSGDELDSSYSADDGDKKQNDCSSPGAKFHSRAIPNRTYSNEYHDHNFGDQFDTDRNVFVNENSSNMAESYDLSKSADSSVLNDANKTNKPTLMFVNRSFGVPPRLPVRDTTKFSEDLASVAGCQSPDANSNSDANAFQFFQKGNSFRRNSQTVIKSGILSKCKYAENGKRIKKQWISCFVYLTSAHMIFYKDEKSAEKKGNQYEAPLGVCDLRGAKLKWLEGDKTRRRRVFQIDLVDGSTYLFHVEDNQEANGWYHAVQQVVVRLPQPDFYPAPAAVETSPKSHLRKMSASGYSFSHKHAHHDLERKSTFTATTSHAKDRTFDTKKSSISGSMSSSTTDSQLHREGILDKLRRFFSVRPTIESLKEKGIYKPEPVFGSSLIEICNRERTVVPKFIKICTSLIEEKGLENDGLYRMSGNLSQVQKIRCQVDQDKYTLLQNETDIHVLTGALKLFFRELPNPLFPCELTKDFLNAIRIQDHKTRLKKFRELIGRMPTSHRDCLDLLLKHLLKVADNASKNRMQIHNLAIVFGPTLFSTDSNRTTVDNRKAKKSNGKTNANLPPKMSAEAIQSNSHLAFTMIMQGQIVEYMLKDHARLFRIEKLPITGGISY